MAEENVENLVIIGSGPAGWTAAIYAARAKLKPLVITGFMAGGVKGGQLTTTTDVENYPGFPEGVQGPKLMELFEAQAKRFETRTLEVDVTEVDVSSQPFTIRHGKGTTMAHCVIVATGAVAKRLDTPGTRDGEFWQKGVSACAVCDGAMPMFQNQPLMVIGGGDSACEEANFLTKYGSKVYMILRRNEFRASKIMAERVQNNPKIEIIYEHEVKEVKGDSTVKSATIENVKTKETQEKEIAGLFFAVGHTPNTGFLKGKVAVDDVGYIQVEGFGTRTSVDGIFAAGDVFDKRYRQAVSAAGMGCMAALDAEKWLVEQKKLPS